MAKNKNVYVDCTRERPGPLFSKAGAIATAVNDQEVYCLASGTKYFEACQNLASTALVATPFAPAATGWLIPSDGAAEGLEITRGIVTGHAQSFVTGTDPAFFVRATFKTTTLANSLLYMVGFRVLAAYEAAFSDAVSVLTAYEEKAVIGAIDAAGALHAYTSKAGTDVDTDLAGVDVATLTWICLEVKVSSAGAVTYRIGRSLVSQALAESSLAADANAVAFTFTAATEVVPVVMHVGTVAGVGDLRMLKFECGYQGA
jgi:hypothetical protein